MELPKIPATVSILTRNSAETLLVALKSVEVFAEVIVCDGGSTDATLDIARQFGARVLEQDARFKNNEGRLVDFAGIRNAILAVATHPWHMYVDSDEYVSSSLIEEIRTLVTAESSGAYWVPRHYVYEGKEITCSIAYPNQQMRVFHRDSVIGFRKPIHERLMLRPNTIPGMLKNVLLVPVELDIDAVRVKTDRYIALELTRQAPITFVKVLTFIIAATKAILRYLYRFLTRMFCHGTRLPLAREWEPLRYELRLASAAIRKLSL